MSFKTLFLKKCSVFLLVVLLLTPIVIVNAHTKYVSMVMKQKSDSAVAVCPVATVKGGALIGGAGIDYNISWKEQTSLPIKYKTLKEGRCVSNTSFDTYVFSSPTKYSVSLRLKETQHDLSKRGIGWGRIDY